MDQQFAIAGYTGSSCLMCAIDGADIWQVDYFGNRQRQDRSGLHGAGGHHSAVL